MDLNGSPLSFSASIEDADFEKGINNIIAQTKRAHESDIKRLTEGAKAQKEYNQILLNSGGAFKNLDRDTALQLNSLTKLQTEFAEVAKAKEKLNAAYASGNTSQATYQASLAALVKQELELAASMSAVGAQLAKSESLQTAGNTALAAKRAEIEKLESAYQNLSKAQQAGGQGKALQSNISALTGELKGLDSVFKSITSNAFGNLEAEVKQLQKVEAQYAGIVELKKELGTIQEKKVLLTQDFEQNQNKAQNYRAELAKLNQEENTLKDNINATKAALKASDAQYDQNSKKIKQEVTQLEKLKAVYNELSKVNPTTPAAKSTSQDISRLEKSVAKGQDAETKILAERAEQASKLAVEYEKLKNLKTQKLELSSNFGEGAKYITQYNEALSELNAKESSVNQAIEKQTSLIQANEAIWQATTQAIEQRTARIKDLEASYDKLNASDKEAPNIGGQIKAEIAGLSTEIDAIKNGFKNLGSDAGQALLAKTNAVKSEFAAIAALELDNEAMLADLTKLQAETAKLRTSLSDMPTFTVEGIQENAEKLAKLRSTFDNLSETEKVSVFGQNTLAEITAVEKELSRVDYLLTSLPALTLGEIDSKKQQLANLNKELESLSDADKLDLNIGGRIEQQVKAITGEINTLEAQLKDLPSLSLGDVQKQLNSLKQLNKEFAGLSDADKLNPEIGGKLTKQIQDLTGDLNKFKASLTQMPELAIKGITERTKDLEKLKAKLDSLPKSQQLDINVGGAITAEIAKVNSEINTLKQSVTNLPALNLVIQNEEQIGKLETSIKEVNNALSKSPEFHVKNLEAETARFAKLEAQLETLSDVEIESELGQKLLADLDASEAKIKELTTTIAALPKLDIKVSANTEALTTLKNQFAELENIRVKKIELTTAGDEAGLSALVAKEKELTAAIAAGTVELIRNKEAQASGNQEIKDKVAQLESLRLSYGQLTESDKNTALGKGLAADIEKVRQEVDKLAPALNSIGTGGISQLKEQFRDLLQVQKELAQVASQKTDLESNYKAGAIDAAAYAKALEGLEKVENDLVAVYVKDSAELKKNNDFQKAGTAIIDAKTKELQKLKSVYQNLPASAKLDVNVGGDLKNQIDGLGGELTYLKDLLKKVDDTNAFDKSATGAAQFKKTIQALKIEMESYKGIVEKATDPAVIQKYNAEISRLGKEIAQIKNAGKDGFDALGRPLKEQLSILGRLERAAKLYQSAIQNATNPANITKYNRKLEETRQEMNRLQNAGKQGFDEMGNAIGKSTNIAGKLFNGLKSIAAFLPGIGLVGLVGLATEPLYEWIKGLDLFKKKTGEAAEARKSFNDVMVKGAQSAQQEITQLKSLFNIAKDTTISLEKRKDAVKELQKQYPDYLGNIKAETILAGGAKDAYDRLSAAIIATGRARAAEGKITENETKKLENEQRLIDLQAEQLKNQKALTEQRRKSAAAATVVNTGTTGAGIGNIGEATKLYQTQLKVSGNLKEQAAIKKENARIDKENLRLAGAINDQVKKGADLTTEDKKAGEKAVNDYLKRYEDMLQKIQVLKDKFNTKALDPDEAAKQAVINEFKNLAYEINKFNKDPKNKLKINIDATGLKALQEKVILDLTYEQDTTKLLKEIERQKGVFADYENYKTQVGKEKADERYQDEKASFDSYKAYLESEINKITSLNIPVADMSKGMKDRLEEQTKKLGEVYKEEKKLRDAAFIEAYNDTISFQDKIARINLEFQKKEQALKEALPNQDISRELAELKTQKDAKVAITQDEYFEKTKIYEQLSQDVIKYSEEEIEAQIKAVKAALANTDITPEIRKQLEAGLETLQITLKIGIDKSYLQDLKAQRKQIEDTLNPKDKSLTAIISPEKVKELVAQLAELNGEIEKAQQWRFDKAAKDLDNMAGVLQDSTALIGKFDEKAAKAVNTLANLAKNASTLITGLGTGDPFSIITGGIGVMTNLIELIDQTEAKQAKAEARREASLQRTKAILAEMSRLLEQQGQVIERALGVDRIAQYNRQLQLISADIISTIKKINASKITIKDPNGRGVKEYTIALANLYDLINVGGSRPRGNDPIGGTTVQLKTLEQVIEANREAINKLYADIASGTIGEAQSEELRELLGQYEELETALESYRNKLREVVTGTTFSGIVDSIADGFRKGFKSAKEQAEFFAQTFEDLMKGAIIESLKMQALEIPLRAFYNEFAKNAEDGLDSGEVQNLQDIYNQILIDAKKQFEALQQVAGIDFKDSSTGSTTNKNSLAGAFSTASAESIDLLSGYTAAVRLLMVESVQIQRQQLAALLSPGSVNLPAAGNNSFSIPGFDLLLGNSNTQTGLQQQLVGVGQQALQVSLDSLSVQRAIEVNTRNTANNTVIIKDVVNAVNEVKKAITASGNAARANGAG